jgi:hypothetical protein
MAKRLYFEHLINLFKEMKKFNSNTVNKLNLIWTKIYNFTTQFLTDIKDGIDKLLNKLNSIWTRIYNFITQFLTDIKDGISKLLNKYFHPAFVSGFVYLIIWGIGWVLQLKWFSIPCFSMPLIIDEINIPIYFHILFFIFWIIILDLLFQKRYLLNHFLFTLIPAILLYVTYSFLKDSNINKDEVYSIPAVSIFCCSLMILIINIIVIWNLYNKEGNLINSNRYRNNCRSVHWWRPSVFFFRFRSARLSLIRQLPLSLSLYYSLFLTCCIFIIGIIITIIFLKCVSIKFANDSTVNFTSFLTGEGTIISFIVIVISIYTFINSEIIKKQNEEISDMRQIYAIIQENLDISKIDDKSRLKIPGELNFMYIYDYSIAAGHTSNEQKFHEHRQKFIDILSNANPPIKLCAIVNSKSRNFDYYKKNYFNVSQYTNNGVINNRKLANDVIKKLKEGHDSYICDLNNALNNPNSEIWCSPYYKCRSCMYNINTITDINIRRELEEKNTIHCTKNGIGPVRFIVSNLFVIQFVAAKSGESKRNPIGFVSEDITLIERYKQAFEECRKEEFFPK